MHWTTRRARTALAMAATVLLAGVSVPTPAQAAGVCPVIAPDGTPDRLASAGVDWSGCNLTGANLAGANLRSANLSDATLTGADLTGADLTAVNMTRAVATNVTFADVIGGGTYENANLTGSRFTRADLRGSDMDYVDLTGTTITDSVFLGASLVYAGFNGAHVRSSDFRNISAPDLHLIGTTIESSTFTNARMGRVFIKDATLTNNTFDQTNIWGAIIVTWDSTFSGNTWVGATCSDNKPSNTYIHSDCLQNQDVNPPFARPTVVGPGTGAGHWYTGPVTVNWNWYEEGVLSDTACPRSTPGVTGPGTVTVTCADMAGHVGTGTYDVRFDLVPPSLSATISHAPNGLNGWWRTAPTVSYTCSDTGSGIARCPSPVTAPQGARTLTATAADVAGNTTTNYAPVKVDTVKPAVAVNLATLNGYGAQVPRCVATDATSGVATCRLTTAASTSVNYRYATATATDKAGNAASSAKVLYRATTVAAFTTAPSSVPRGGRFSVVVTSKNAKGALINLTGVRALLPVKTTSTGSGPANTTLSTYATRIGTGTYRVTFTAPRTGGYYRYAVRVGNATTTKVIRIA